LDQLFSGKQFFEQPIEFETVRDEAPIDNNPETGESRNLESSSISYQEEASVPTCTLPADSESLSPEPEPEPDLCLQEEQAEPQATTATTCTSTTTSEQSKANTKAKPKPKGKPISATEAPSAAPHSAKSKSRIVDAEKALSAASARAGAAEVDVDAAVLSRMQQLNSRCSVQGCRESTRLLGDLTACAHCKLRFCLRHAQAEVHGCGDAAHRAARSDMRRDFEQGRLTGLSAGAGAGGAAGLPPRNAKNDFNSSGAFALRQMRHENLQKKLDRKLVHLADERKGNRKDGPPGSHRKK